MQVHVVIPARLASHRLPEKLLLRAQGKSVLQHTYEAAKKAERPTGVTVAVDDPRLEKEVQSFGGHVVLTDPQCASGTDRVAEVAKQLADVDVFVNVQGDEPEVDPGAIDLAVDVLLSHPTADLSTVATPLRSPDRFHDPACVKVVRDSSGKALYFSRTPIPGVRDISVEEALSSEPPLFWHHLGLYAYRRPFLVWFAAQPPGRLEQLEKLEQLRALEAGKMIVVGSVPSATPGIDTQADFDQFVQRIEGRLPPSECSGKIKFYD